MKVKLFDNPKGVSEREFVEDLEKVPKWRQEKALKYRFLIDRVLSVKAFLLLKEGLKEEFGIDEEIGENLGGKIDEGTEGNSGARAAKRVEINSDNIETEIGGHRLEISYLKHGKPVFKGETGIHFNLSHCKNGVLCVVDEKEVGCDIEDIPETLDIRVCKKAFNDEEVQRVLESEKPCVEFTRLWTMKEALLKLDGTGIATKLSEVLVDERVENVEFTTVVCEEKGYVYTVAR